MGRVEGRPSLDSANEWIRKEGRKWERKEERGDGGEERDLEMMERENLLTIYWAWGFTEGEADGRFSFSFSIHFSRSDECLEEGK